MAARITCPECDKRFVLDPDSQPGDRVRCPACDMRFRIPNDEVDQLEEVDAAPRRRKKPRPAASGGSGKMVAIVAGLVVGGVVLFAGLITIIVLASQEPDPPSGITLKQARSGFQTQLTHPRMNFADGMLPPPPNVPQPPPGTYNKVRYPSQVGELVGYLTPPPPDRTRKHPAVIWAHEGFEGLGEDAWDDEEGTAAFRKAGFVVFCPSWRAEIENPGRFEFFFGEVDDAVSAINYIAQLPHVDPQRIYMVGQSNGGTLTLLAALSSERLRAAFSLGGAPDIEHVVRDGEGYGNTPYNWRDRKESRLRSAVDYVSTLKVPTFYFGGDDDDAMYNRDAARMERLAKKAGTPFQAFKIRDEDHFSFVEPITKLIAQKIKADTGPQCGITMTLKEAQDACEAANR